VSREIFDILMLLVDNFREFPSVHELLVNVNLDNLLENVRVLPRVGTDDLANGGTPGIKSIKNIC
jgi:hypothetical protein